MMWVSVMHDVTHVTVTDDLWMSVYVVDVDEGNNEGVCDDMLDMEKIITNSFLINPPVLSFPC
jgi:hypothetical protein